MSVSDETISGRELELLQLLADGKTLEQAAEEMGLREQTAKNYMYDIRHKLDASTTVNAAVIAVRRELID